MLSYLGNYFISSSLCLASVSIFFLIHGIRSNSSRSISLATLSTKISSLLVILSYLVLVAATLKNDFSVKFVAGHSSSDLPIFYKFSATWGGMEGSLLLWHFILSIFTLLVVQKRSFTQDSVSPYAVGVLNYISIFLLILLNIWSNPFDSIFPIPQEGKGLNPLLQNPLMVIHPPSLYLGFIGFSIPFAYAIGSLIRGKIDVKWVVKTRRWTLISWLFLSFGLIIGGQWAYVELGWGGYWAWDPVENSALMPWLTGTAFIHSIIVQEKRNTLKIWNMMLIIITFTLTILGTFITRSGVLNSVHAFARTNIGPAFLIFIALTLAVCLSLIFYRMPILATKPKTIGLVNKENSFLFNNVLFLGIAFTVLYGTTFPLLAEGLANKKLSIQAPFFNSITAPMVYALIILMGITPFIAWKRNDPKKLKKNLYFPLFGAFAVMLATYSYDMENFRGELIILSGIISFSFLSVVNELKKSAFRNSITNRLTSIWKDKRRWGGMLVHIGILCLFLGILGNFYKVEKSFTIKPGEIFKVKDYELIYRNADERRNLNALEVVANIDVFKDGKPIKRMLPGKSFYPTSNEPTTEVSFYRRLNEDLYISLASINEDNSATLNVFINPLIIFVPLSLAFICIGMIFSFSYVSPQLNAKSP